jgi:hypothetical protein
MVDFQKAELIAPAVGTMLTAEYVHCSLSYPTVLLSPLAPFFLGVVITTLLAAFAVGSHVFPHILSVLTAALFGSSITLVLLCHIGSITYNGRPATS